MKLKITAWQRFQCIQSIGRLQGNVALLHLAGKLFGILNFSDDEKGEISYKDLPGGGAAWRDSDRIFDIEIKDGNQSDMLKRALGQRDDWLAASHEQALDLLEQVGAKIAEPEDD